MISFSFSITIIFRIIILLIVFSSYFQTTLPEDLSQSMIKFKIPYPIAFSLSLSFRFVPTMAIETEIIKDAQLSRGHRLDEGGMINQVKNFFPLLIPLLANSIRRAFHVAEALETRAFGASKNPTYYYPLKLKIQDWIFMIFNCIMLAVGIFIDSNLNLLPNWVSWNISL